VPYGSVTGKGANSLYDQIQGMYFNDKINIMVDEITKERQLSELQIKRMYDNGQITKETAEQVRNYRELINQMKVLQQAEDIYYQTLEKRAAASKDIGFQMNVAIAEAVRQLSSQYETVKSSTQTMFNTLREGLSNVLVAGFQGDTDKMRDIWKQLVTDIKNTFLKMISDLIVNSLMKSLFGGMFEGGAQAAGEKGLSQLQTAMGSTATGLEGLSSMVLPQFQFAIKGATTALQNMALGGVSGANLGGLGSNFMTEQGSLLDMIGSVIDFGGSILDSSDSFFDWTSFAKGGVVTSPTLSMLGDAGTEAAIPMPDGKAVPVKMLGKENSGVIELTIVNVLDPSAINASIARDPKTVINVISEDYARGGTTKQVIQNKR
jgi:hypothetical protein